MTPKQIKVARALLDWTQRQLYDAIKGRAARGPVSLRTIENFESATARATSSTVFAIERTLGKEGISFDEDGVNVRLTVKPKRKG